MAIRLAIYGILAAVVTETLVRGASNGWFEAFGSEGGPIEYAHYALCGAAAFVFACAGARHPTLRDVFALAALGASLGVVREADALLDHTVFQGAYKAPAAFLGALALLRTYRARAVLADQCARWMGTPAFAVTASGVFLVLVYAQIVGQKELWQALMGDSYLRPVKDVAEEMQELAGYLLIFFGALESYALAHVADPVETIGSDRKLN